ncbi:MAG: hypothetical protein PHQ91_13910 [Thermoanaerobaculaceae bacterium]|nr:hypothetical protein [Thermoanaerobaculaceae bacterium]TAM53369.1 MAG: hypothetical protein EPN53_05155 [Acidobacteriota bacterium]
MLSIAQLALAQTALQVRERPPVQGIAPLFGPAPDLRVTRVLVSKVECNEPLCLRVRVEIRNLGEGTKGPIDVRLSYKTKYEAPWMQLETFHFAAQAHNHDTAVQKLFSFRESGDYCFLAEIDPGNVAQPAAVTKSRASDCQHYDAGIPDPAARRIRVSRCQHDNINASHCFGDLEVQNVGDGKLDGTIKVEFECAANGQSFRKLVSGFDTHYKLQPNEISNRGWVVTVDSKDVETLRCRATLTPSFRERSSANNAIGSDLWHK